MHTPSPCEDTVEGLLESLHLPVVVYRCLGDDRWTCVGVSDSLERKFGISPDAWTSDPHVWLQHVHPDDRERLVVDRVTAIDEQRKMSTEYRLRTRDGRYRWVHDEAEVVSLDDAEQPMVYGMLNDITHRRHSDVILSELYEASRGQVSQLQGEVEERDLFARLLAHDLRMPLTAAAEALAGLGPSDADEDGPLGRARRAIAQARQLVGSVLDLERWVHGHALRIETVDLREVTSLAVEMIGFDEHLLELDVPDAEAKLDVLVVSRALANLVDNAVRHSPPGGTVRLRAYEQTTPPSVIFTVEDEGPGLPPSLGEDVFRPFVTSRRAHDEAHGLGLALVQRLAQLHGGRVWWEELPVGGLAFHMLVPQS